MVWALILVLLFPQIALAEGEDIEVTPVEVIEEVSTPVDDGRISDVVEKVQEVKQEIQVTSAALSAKLDENIKAIGDASKPVEDETQKDILVTLEDINGKLDTIIIDGQEESPKPVQAVKANGATFTAYGNVSRTGQYASYAAGLVPKVAWNEDYVFLQDSSSSYVFVAGDCDFRSSGEFTFSDARYTRWYYAGTGTGYLVQSGTGTVVVHGAGYTVLSSCGDYPLLDDGTSLMRQEVAFYAIAACAVYCLSCVRGFLLRMAK